MYVLLNLKDGSRLSEVVQLLFAHGHTAVSVAESIEDLCPRCEFMTRHAENSVELPQRVNDTLSLDTTVDYAFYLKDSATPQSSFTSELKSQMATVTSSEEVDLSSDGRIPDGGTFPLTAPSGSAEEITEHRTLHQRMVATPATTSSPPIVNVKEEATEKPRSQMGDNAVDETVQFSITSALELLCNAGPSTANQDDLDLDITAERSTIAPPSKRIARLKELGLETFQCQLCNKAITRQGQYANLVNHLSRHARLHASRKQYCCPVCRATFSRRYLAYAHVREAHPKHGFVEPLDHGRELRDEYRALLEVCFPGAKSRRKTASQPPADEDHYDARDALYKANGAPSNSNELSRLF